MYFKKPPVIVHWHKPKELFMEMAQDACKNVRLSKQASKLFMYYAECKSGFRPAIKVISEKLMISDVQTCNLRIDLMKHGLVGYGDDFDNILVIDWNRVRAFAILDKPLQYVKANTKDYFRLIQPVKEKRANAYRRNKTIDELGQRYIIKQQRIYSDEEVKLYEFLDGLTEGQYEELVCAFDPSVVFGGKMMTEEEHRRFVDWQKDREFDNSWMHTEEYQRKLAQDIAYLKAMPQKLPF